MNYYNLIICGGVMVPLSHWIYLKSQTPKLDSEIVELKPPARGYEISRITPIGSEIFLKSKFTATSKSNLDLKINLDHFRSSMYDVPCSKSESIINSFSVKKIQYKKAVYVHPPTRQISNSRHQLLRDIQLLKISKSLLVASLCICASSYCMFSDYLLTTRHVDCKVAPLLTT